MDAQHRLTLWDEWTPGATYEYVLGDVVRGSYVCRDVRPAEGYVRLQEAGCPPKLCYKWRGRYRKKGIEVDAPAPELAK